MASLTMTSVLCRAPVVGGRVTRVSPAAARGTASSSTKTGQPSSVSLPGSVRLFGPRPESRSVRQRTALNAITDTTEPVAGVEEKPEPELKSDVRRTRCPTGFAPGPPVRTRFSSSHFSASVPTLARSNGVSRRARRRVPQTPRPLRVNHVTRIYGKRTHWMRLRATPPSSTPAKFPHPTETLTDLPKYPLLTPKTKTTSTQIESKNPQVGVDYAPFRDLLKAGEWRLADDEHRRLMCVLAGEDAEDRGWVYFTEARAFPVTDLKTIDTLWTFYSNGKFGFSVQRKIWVGQRRQWLKMFRQINWTNDQENECYRKFPEEYIWSIDAAKGHMPLTNALRGTQLLEALLEHPAFAPPKKVKSQAELATESAQETFTEVTKKAEDVMGNVMKGLKGLKKPSWMK